MDIYMNDYCFERISQKILYKLILSYKDN